MKVAVKGEGVPLVPSALPDVAGSLRDNQRGDVDSRGVVSGLREVGSESSSEVGTESSKKSGRFLTLLAAVSVIAGCFYFGLCLGNVWGGGMVRRGGGAGAVGVRKEERPVNAKETALARDAHPPDSATGTGGNVEIANVTVYVAEKYGNPALSVFRTGVLDVYGSGRVQFNLVDHSKFDCHKQCLTTGRPLIANASLMGEGQPNGQYCIATGRERACKHKHLACNYPRCKTLVLNDERCGSTSRYDAREYYTEDLPDKGYLPLGPRIDAWKSFRKLMQQPATQKRTWFGPKDAGFQIKKASERKYAFNAIFSQSTNGGRRQLATLLQEKEKGNVTIDGFEVFTKMAKKWNGNVNSPKTKQLNTDDYATAIFDSAFTLAPAGHNSECYRLYEAVEAGSIPIVVRKDLYKKKPCRHSLIHWFDAPIVVLRSWDELYPTVTKLVEDKKALDGRQADLREWYVGFMRERVRAFEDFVMGDGKKAVGLSEPVRNETLKVDARVEKEAANPTDVEVKNETVMNGTTALDQGEKVMNDTLKAQVSKEALNLTDIEVKKNEPVGNDATALEKDKDNASDATEEVLELDVEKETPSPTKPAVEERTRSVRYILGHGTGHAGSTALQSALGKGGCPWKTVSAFERIPSAAKAYDYGTTTMERYEPEDVEALRASCRPTLASFGRRLPEDTERRVAYLDMGHFHNRGRVLECLAAELKENVTFIRTRRARYDIARSFSADLTTPCTGKKFTYKKVKKVGHPRVSLCPRSTETGGRVNLPVSDEVWDGFTSFQRFLWYADEMESRWHLLRATHDGPQYLEVTWSNSSELEQGVGSVRKALGCSAIDMVKNKKSHVKHGTGALNCTELIRQDCDYRRKMNYDEMTKDILFSQYSSAYHGNIDDCMETASELQRVLDSMAETTSQESKHQQVQAIDRVENESPNATHLADHQQSSTTELIQQLCAQKSFSLAEYPPGKVNSMRRALAAENRSCYEDHFSAFAEYTRARLDKVKRHLSLHIPKAGGSSLCNLAKSVGLQTPKSNNCWDMRHGYPLWGIGKFKDRREWTHGCGESSHCDEFVDATVPAFTMNENYLDHPLLPERLYSVLLREPIDRAMSQERHLEKFRKRKENKAWLPSINSTVFDARLALARRNYQTWALAVGTEPWGYRKRVLLSPREEHLAIAKDTLSQFDFLLELSQNSTCETATLDQMGMGGTSMGRARTKVGSKPEMSEDRDLYSSWNSLDIELHRYARRLIELDCEFFLRLEKGAIPAVQRME